MKHIGVGSTSKVKLDSTLEAFVKVFPDDQFEVHGVDVPSGVPDQPRGEEETLRGARHRAEAASRELPDMDFWVGHEGGIEEKENETEAFAWMVIKSREGTWGKGRTGSFFLPPKIAELIKQGKELGHAANEVFGTEDAKQRGTVGLLTGGVIDRKAYYVYALALALIPFKNPDMY